MAKVALKKKTRNKSVEKGFHVKVAVVILRSITFKAKEYFMQLYEGTGVVGICIQSPGEELNNYTEWLNQRSTEFQGIQYCSGSKITSMRTRPALSQMVKGVDIDLSFLSGQTLRIWTVHRFMQFIVLNMIQATLAESKNSHSIK